MSFALSSPAFPAHGGIPARYTCDSDGLSPPLTWSAPPRTTRSLVLIVDDPDAPDPAAPRRRFVHWVLYNIPPTVSTLPEGIASSALPEGTREGLNDARSTGYTPPCPPVGRHRYVFTLYALDAVLPDLRRPTRGDVERALDGHVLARAELIGTYERRR